MKRCYTSAKHGAVLIWALILLGLSTTVVGSLSAYYTNIGRLANFYLNRGDLRVAGKRDIGNEMVIPIQEVLNEVNAQTTGLTGDFNSAETTAERVAEKLQEVLQEIDGKEIKQDDYTVKLSVDGLDALKQRFIEFTQNPSKDNLPSLTLNATVVQSRSGGIPVGMNIRETIKFDYGIPDDTDSAERTIYSTRPIYDYVYFANNYGRLLSSAIVANGDVGANADFQLSGATVNGFVKSAGVVDITGSDRPKTWPRNTYLARAAAEYDGYFTQVRPTDPITGSRLGVAYSVAWAGGYDPSVSKNPYAEDFEQPPTPVSPPGTKPTEVANPGDKPDPPTYQEPTLESYPEKDPYPTEPQKGKGDYAYPDEPYKFIFWWYTPLGQKNEQRYSSKNKAYEAYNKDIATQDAKWQKAHDAWVTQCAKIDDDHQAACDAVDARNNAKIQQAQQAYQTALTEYNNVTLPKYKEDLKKYQEYLQKLSDWNAADLAYQNYLLALQDYETRLNAYLAQRAAWDSSVEGGSKVEELTKQTYVESSVTNLVIKERVEKVEWPEEFSKYENCRKYCKEYSGTNSVSSSALPSGSLVCKNRADNKSIQFTLSGKNRQIYVSTGKGSYYNKGEEFFTNYVAEVKLTRTLASVDIAGGSCDDAFVPFVGDTITCDDSTTKTKAQAQLTEIKGYEKGSVILIGTQDNPIMINGPVFINGDVMIRGLVSGRGTIYARRNIHIIGDISYLNPPNWPHSHEDLNLEQYAPENVKSMNSKKDMLSLVSLGNIIVGDYTSTVWTTPTQMSYLDQSGNNNLPITTVEAGIGSENHNYTAEDGGKTVMMGYAADGKADVIDGSDGRPHYIDGFSTFFWDLFYYDLHTYRYIPRTRARRYYESVFGGETLAALKQTSVTADTPTWAQSPTFIKQWFWDVFGGNNGGENNGSSADPSGIVNTDAGDITEIDAILFSNNGIFGVVGGTSSHKFTLNGAMICRDEGLLTSFDNRFSAATDARLWLNWDMRIKSDSAEGIRSGALEDVVSSVVKIWMMRITDYQELSAE